LTTCLPEIEESRELIIFNQKETRPKNIVGQYLQALLQGGNGEGDIVVPQEYQVNVVGLPNLLFL
jgi:hypothetical protein